MIRSPKTSLAHAALVLAALVTAAIAPPAAAQAGSAPASPTALRYRGYINDFAGVIDPESLQKLTRLATVLDEKTKAQMAVVTIDTLSGEPIEDFTNRLFETWGVGHKDNRGLLLLLVIKDRGSRLEVGYGLEPIIPDGFAGSVLREMRPALREQRYGPALLAGCSLLAAKVAQESGVKLDGAELPPRTATPSGAFDRLVNRLVNGFLLVVFLVFLPLFLCLRLLAALGVIRGDWVNAGTARGRLGGGMGGFGGGFGGYDSGGGSSGGFGGFGGGMSGGGGASSGW